MMQSKVAAVVGFVVIYISMQRNKSLLFTETYGEIDEHVRLELGENGDYSKKS